MALILGVAGGGVVGVLSRYGIDTYVERRSGSAFPWATFLINVSGCLAVGFVIAALVDRERGPQWLRVGLVMGFCGGFTTFSTFAQESLDLLQDEKAAIALASIAANVVLGLAAVWPGRASGGPSELGSGDLARPLVPRAGVVPRGVAGAGQHLDGEAGARADVAVGDDLRPSGRPTSARTSSALRQARMRSSGTFTAPGM